MIILIVADDKAFRSAHVTKTLTTYAQSEVLRHQDTPIAELEQYIYPSLFVSVAPVVHISFGLSDEPEAANALFLKKLMASPTLFLFEEMTLPAGLITVFQKSGAVVHRSEIKKTAKKTNDIFAVTKALTNPDKKSRWIAYRTALVAQPIEAIIGILYWKLQDLIAKNPKDKERYVALYKNMLSAHMRAWESGAPLEAMIEKVLLSQ